MQQRYNLLPATAPLTQPASCHSAALPCGQGHSYPGGAMVMRGGIFEGPSVSSGAYKCGYWGQDVRSAQPVAWPLVAPGRVPVGARVNPMPLYPPHQRVPVVNSQPTPSWSSEWERPTSAISMAGDLELLDPMRLVVNRGRRIWPGPAAAQPEWPQGMTPRGGVLDGNSLAGRRASVADNYAAYFDATSPTVMLPPQMVEFLPDSWQGEDVPDLGWGVEQPAPSSGVTGVGPYSPPSSGVTGFGAYPFPSARVARGIPGAAPISRRAHGDYGAPGTEAAAHPVMLRRGRVPEMTPQPLARSIFGGAVPGQRTLGRSTLGTPVRSNSGGSIPFRTTVDPTVRSVLATNTPAALSAFGVGPDGLG